MTNDDCTVIIIIQFLFNHVSYKFLFVVCNEDGCILYPCIDGMIPLTPIES